MAYKQCLSNKKTFYKGIMVTYPTDDICLQTESFIIYRIKRPLSYSWFC